VSATGSAPGVRCPVCGGRNGPGEPFCDKCGCDLLTESPAEPTPVGPATAEQTDGAEPGPDHSACPYCGAVVPHPDNTFCVECLEELPPAGASERGGAAATLQLRFAGGTVVLPMSGTVVLGRASPTAEIRTLLEVRDNVSRTHASIRVDGQVVFVRDEGSANGTFVNDRPVPRRTEVRIEPGDVLRLASDVTATLERGHRP
jgi:hypothetical protein